MAYKHKKILERIYKDYQGKVYGEALASIEEYLKKDHGEESTAEKLVTLLHVHRHLIRQIREVLIDIVEKRVPGHFSFDVKTMRKRMEIAISQAVEIRKLSNKLAKELN